MANLIIDNNQKQDLTLRLKIKKVTIHNVNKSVRIMMRLKERAKIELQREIGQIWLVRYDYRLFADVSNSRLFVAISCDIPR